MSEQPEFTNGEVDEPVVEDGVDHWTAGIDHHGPNAHPYPTWLNRIEVYGDSKVSAEDLRDRILAALDVPFTAEDIQILEDLVSLGGTKAEEAITRGHRSWDPLPKDRMMDLATSGYGRAFEILKQLKIMQEGRS